MRQIVEFQSWGNVSYDLEDVVDYKVRKDRPLVWLQKLCLWVMQKLKAYDTVKGFRLQPIDRHVVDTTTFSQHIMGQREHIARYFPQIKPTKLLIGSVDYMELMNDDVVVRSLFSFNTKYFMDGHLFDLEVFIIPWMKGILLLNDDVLVRKINEKGATGWMSSPG